MMISLWRSAVVALPVITYASFTPTFGNHFGIPGINETFDYVVVGGGTAGLTVAYRLAEDTTKTVAVIEGGGFSAV